MLIQLNKSINSYEKNKENNVLNKEINRYTIQLHERDQSFALKKFYKWSHSIYVYLEEAKE